MNKAKSTAFSDLLPRTQDLEPKDKELTDLMNKTIAYAMRFLSDVGSAPAYQGDQGSSSVIENFPIGEEGKPYSDILEMLQAALESSGINAASPHHMGYVPGGGIVTSALGDFLAAIGNEYAGLSFASPGGVAIENLVLDWLKVLLEFPADSVGNLSSGGSVATLTAIVAARHWRKITPENIRTQVIYSTAQLHHCVHKSLRIAGLDFCIHRQIAMEDDYTLSVIDLKSQIDRDRKAGLKPFMIMASAGSTDVGAIDPLEQITSIAVANQCWCHVDAAFGGFFKLVPALGQHFKGIGKADSVVIDPHKGLFLAYGSGAVLIKNKEAALNAFEYRAHYMQDAIVTGSRPDPADLSPELTKHFRGLRMWLSLQYFGVDSFRKALIEKLALTQHFYRRVQDLGYAVGPTPVLTAVIFRISSGSDLDQDNLSNRVLLNEIQDDGRVYLSSTTIDDVFWLRICILVFRTHLEHVERLLQILEAKGTK